MTFPQWLDPTPITRQFIGAFSGVPVREVSQAHEFREARLESDALQKEQRKGNNGTYVSAQRRAATRLKDMQLRKETPQERRNRQRRESRQRCDERDRRLRAAELERLSRRGCAVERSRDYANALGSNALRGGGSGEESSSPGGRP